MGRFQFGRTQTAGQTPFDNSTNGFQSSEMQAVTEEIDYHSGVEFLTQTKRIFARKQMVVHSLFTAEETLILDGSLVVFR